MATSRYDPPKWWMVRNYCTCGHAFEVHEGSEKKCTASTRWGKCPCTQIVPEKYANPKT